eukprot:Nitzschia sp. Nitz4//scaffold116_size91068//47064//48282//NITZ4_004958-RA/size91068-processed-gene-0.28-mRNA-1//1//CDS//3329533578//9400//frame0
MGSSFIPFSETAYFKSFQSEGDPQGTRLSAVLPPLAPDSYKGSSGRIGILGGSARYTGAPFYAAMASLKVGADLAFCFCAQEASLPIKCYSPELMVAPVYSAEEFDHLVASDQKGPAYEAAIQNMVDRVKSDMDRLHALVIGPGLGRCPMVLEATSRIIRIAIQEKQIPLVIDADGLFLLTQDPSALKASEGEARAPPPVVLTPNLMERRRLNGMEHHWTSNHHVILIEKGAHDTVEAQNSAATTSTLVCEEVGGWKRSGGIGDILAGTLGTVVAWNRILQERGVASEAVLPWACWVGCSFVKRATHTAFHRHYRSMTAPDVLAELGGTVHEMTSLSSSSTS